MSKIFEFELTTKPADLLKQAQQMAEKNGASFTIKHNYGKFNWNGIKGSMRVHEGKLIITILDKINKIGNFTRIIVRGINFLKSTFKSLIKSFEGKWF